MNPFLNICVMSKVDFKSLKSVGLFPLEDGEKYVVYAPLADACFEADYGSLEQLETAVANGSVANNPDLVYIKELISEFKSHEFRKYTPYELTGISILPTWNCNFNCSYCYAANAHKRKNIELSVAAKAIDFFFTNMGTGEVSLQILGGGEPFTEWNLLRNIARMAREAETAHSRKLIMSVATNGSIINDEIINDIIDLDLRLSFSFDVLEDIQNIQRASYKVVSDNLHKLLVAGLGDHIYIRTVITKNSVLRLREIVDEVINHYPGVCGVIAEPVMGTNNFSSVTDYSEFCGLFYTNFKAARRYAKAHGLNFTTMALRNVDYSINYGCEGDFCVTPDGEISICHRLSTPAIKGIDKFDVYGTVSSEYVDVYPEKYLSLLGQDVNSRMECASCFAKYNCGGGCITRNLSETPESKQIYCDLFRKLVKDEIIQRFNNLQS